MKTTKFELSKSCHGMTCIQAVDCSEEQLHSLHGIITNNWKGQVLSSRYTSDKLTEYPCWIFYKEEK